MRTYAQWIPDDSRRQDTLTVAERISFRTNGVDWLLLVPNVGIEYDIANNKNWNRWSVGLNFRYKWSTSHTFVPNRVFNIFETKLEFRNYWRTRLIDGEGVKAHTGMLDRLMSQRRHRLKHPLTTYYRGLFASYAKYSVRFAPGSTGYEGQAVMGGFVYGIQRPLYRFRNGRSIDLELGVSAGLAWVRYTPYTVDREHNTLRPTGNTVGWRDLTVRPVVNELRAGLVYRIGRKEGYSKYRFRYDVDLKYAYTVDSLRDERAAKAYRDSVAAERYRTVSGYYRQQLDSITKADPEAAKSDARLMKERLSLLKKQQRKERKAQAKQRKSLLKGKKRTSSATE
ncbi:MAG: DUF3575 domain-containing protein [Bacteroidales bacterium]|nr:DUF3575 domain-containing protein [Bacteroidales bacterium]MCM1146792.1 DUF3575 domain-containing protein [Bacteroidales bacterium]MCM1205711.1 DUF3575 domain-containing protein [Bacillota bacterium]MCM1510759.1 DUF3575 domain-containing protein [Clostridium sp.]